MGEPLVRLTLELYDEKEIGLYASSKVIDEFFETIWMKKHERLQNFVKTFYQDVDQREGGESFLITEVDPNTGLANLEKIDKNRIRYFCFQSRTKEKNKDKDEDDEIDM